MRQRSSTDNTLSSQSDSDLPTTADSAIHAHKSSNAAESLSVDDAVHQLPTDPFANIETSASDEPLSSSGIIVHANQRDRSTTATAVPQHPVREGCGIKCKRQCGSHFDDQQRETINAEFWAMNYNSQRSFILHSTRRLSAARRQPGSRRSLTFEYFLVSPDGDTTVCKTFFLTTLGFAPNNDQMVMTALHCTTIDSIVPAADQRGRALSAAKIDRGVIQKHVESFHPCVSHYRREHAPNRLYLPSDISIRAMHSNFLEQHNMACGYEVYRSVVKEMNISFTKLGHEACEVCEGFKLHGHNKDSRSPDCETCQRWSSHIQKAEEARRHYRIDADAPSDASLAVVSADLQKVIMLPRIDEFKAALFTRRLVAFNESFIPVGKQQLYLRPLAVIWHEAVSGRKREDITSAFHAFLMQNRDMHHIVIWLDNCSAQNKNWCLLSFIVYMVNSDEIAADSIELKFFEPGHTFMSADSFHHQVELSMKKKKRVYDFSDFEDCVRKAAVGGVDVKSMAVSDFCDWPDVSSSQKLKNAEPRPYLADFVCIRAERGEHAVKCKTAFDAEPTTVDFIGNRALQRGLSEARRHERPRGVPQNKKDDIIRNLAAIIPSTRITFWEELPVADVHDLVSEQDID